MVGILGSEAVAAVGMSQQVIMTLAVPVMGVSMGGTAVIAKYYGRNDPARTFSTVRQIFLLTLVFALFISTIGFFKGEELLKLLGAEQKVLELGSGYLKIIFMGTVLLIGKFPLWGLFQGLGDTQTPLKLDMISNIVNLTCNYLLIFGIGFFPALGIRGAALGSVLANGLTLSLGLSSLKNRFFLNTMSFNLLNVRIHLTTMKEIVAIGVPASLHGIIQVITNALIIGLMARIQEGAEVVSAYSISMVVFGFTTFPAGAIATVAASMVGINLGYGDTTRAYKSGWACAFMGSFIVLFMALLTYIFGPNLIGFFVKDIAVIEAGSPLLRLLAVTMPVHAVGVVLGRAMHGAGDARTPLLVAAVTGLGVRIPLAYVSAMLLGFGTTGVWLAISVTQLLSAMLLAAGFKRTLKLWL